MCAKFNSRFGLFKLDEREAVEKSVTADKAVAVLREFRHEADGGLLPPTTDFDLNIVEVVRAALAGNDARDGAGLSGWDVETDKLTNLCCEDAVVGATSAR